MSDCWTKGFYVVDSMYLRKSLCYKPCFVPLNRAIRSIFYLEYILATNCFLIV